jgi:hypothetical protein
MGIYELKIIGLVGKKRVGKDTAADAIVRELGPSCARVAFADPLKQGVCGILGFESVESMEDKLGKESPITWLGGVSLRTIYQTLGTEWGRKMIHRDMWLILMHQRLKRLAEAGYTTVIITDIRFNNEVEFVRRLKGELIYIRRAEAKELKPWWVRFKPHSSEAGVVPLGGDSVIQNNGSLESFRHEVLRVVEALIYEE